MKLLRFRQAGEQSPKEKEIYLSDILSSSGSTKAERGVRKEVRRLLKDARRNVDACNYEKADIRFESAKDIYRMAGFSTTEITLRQMIAAKKKFFRDARFARRTLADYIITAEEDFAVETRDSMEYMQSSNEDFNRLLDNSVVEKREYESVKENEQILISRGREHDFLPGTPSISELVRSRFGRYARVAAATGGVVGIASLAVSYDAGFASQMSHGIILQASIVHVTHDTMEGGFAVAAVGGAVGLRHYLMDKVFEGKTKASISLKSLSLKILTSEKGYYYSCAVDIPHSIRQRRRDARTFRKYAAAEENAEEKEDD